MDSPTGVAVKAQGFGLRGPRGWVFQGVDVDAAPGSLIAVEGPSGTGRTCLLLALTGRMKPTAGHAEVGGLRLPKKMAAVRRISALGPVPGITDLDPALTVAEQLRERALLQRRYDGPVRALFRPRSERAAHTARRIDAALDAVGLDVAALPKGARTSVRELERLEELRLSLALALISGPGLLAVDDTDLKLSDAERVEAWALLRSLAARGTTVLAVCSEAPADALVIRTTAAGAPGEDPAPQGGTTDAPRGTDSAEAEEAGPGTAPADAGRAPSAAGPDGAGPTPGAEPADTGTATTAPDPDAEGTGTTVPDQDTEDTGTGTTETTDTTAQKGAADAHAEAGRA
ncbi:ATP-binding cassette domain-containing protein [Streptomyces sp. NPDC101132]|uniref:ATP-binding cassette domain-containing protein n=1 Tax=Streptomyces sp. NPDC101132 TaxID=3366110 RepID=UPI00382342F6